MLLNRRFAPILAPLLAILLPACSSLRVDDSVQRNRSDRAALASLEADPRERPSYRELRQARATAWVERDIMENGGELRVRPDGSASRPQSVDFVAEPGALALAIGASEDLNQAGGLPHALTLVVYHLADRAALDRLAASEEGMRTLLEATFFDDSVRAVRRIPVQPGMRTNLALDRAEKGRYVALVAGYHNLESAASLHVAAYDIGQYNIRDDSAVGGNMLVFSRKKTMFRPLPLNLRVDLGPDAMLVSPTGKIFNNLRDAQRMLKPYY